MCLFLKSLSIVKEDLHARQESWKNKYSENNVQIKPFSEVRVFKS